MPTLLAYAEGPQGIAKPTFLDFAAWNGFFGYVCKQLEQTTQAEATECASRMLLLALIKD